MAEETVKFLHIADVHLDRLLHGGRLDLPIEKAKIRENEIRRAFRNALDLASDEKVEVILISGDLWDEETLRAETISFVMDSLGGIKLPVFIAPGNEDNYSAISHYSNHLTYARFGRKWPPNTLIFKLNTFTHHKCNTLPHAQFSGMGLRAGDDTLASPFETKITIPDAMVKIGLMHCSRDGYIQPGKSRIYPFTDDELLKQDFDYVALGHLHEKSTVIDGQGLIRAAYPGSLCALEMKRRETAGVIVATAGVGGLRQDDFKHIELDDRRIKQIGLDISRLKSVRAIENKLQEEIEDAGIRREDMLYIELRGKFQSSGRLALSRQFIESICFHVKISTERVEADLRDLSTADSSPNTTETGFRDQMREQINEAIIKGDRKNIVRLQQAYYYGLEALYDQPIKPRDV